MSSRRRRKSRRKESAAPSGSSPRAEVVVSEAVSGERGSVLRVVFGWDGSRPIPLPLVAAAAGFVAVGLPTKFPAYVNCPQAAHGVGRVAASIVVGLAIGGGLTSIIMIATTLAITSDRNESSSGATRIGVERAGLGAAYGTAMSILATVNTSHGSPCSPDLLSNISNGATWGTMLGFTFSLMAPRKGMLRDAKSTERPYVRKMFVNSANLSLLFGVATTFLLIDELMRGRIWPK